MHQLILGDDASLRDRILRDLKTRFLKTPDALKFDCTGLDAHGLDFNDLKAALLTVPAVAERRIIIISRAEKLDDRNLELIDHVVCEKEQQCVIVLEAISWDRRSALRKHIADKVRVSGGEEKKIIFDVLDGLERDGAGALLKVEAYLGDDAVENVLGAVRWWWVDRFRKKLLPERYKKGLLVIQEADERIKLSGLLVKEQALEVALVKLSSLLKV